MGTQTEEMDALRNIIEHSSNQISIHQQIASACQVDEETIELHKKLIQLITEINNVAHEIDVPYNYLNQFQNDITQVINLLPHREYNDLDFLEHNDKLEIKKNIERSGESVRLIAEQISFNLDFFKKLGFFKDNIVAVGANGCGKTSLANDLKSHLSQNGVVISAQKILIIPTFSGISNIQSTAENLKASQTSDKTYKTTYSSENIGGSYQTMMQMGGEFLILLSNLLAERNAARNRFCDELNNRSELKNVPKTNLDNALDIWNSLLPHRTISCSDGMNIMLTSQDGQPYPAYQMSDGEKVILFLVAQVLQAPLSGFIVIDEPEMYLHKTIINKLWDTLEAERKDCIFIYLTHDLDFAVSRISAKKIWIRSFTFPDQWTIEDIPENEIPEQLLMELLGSRKNILFCEGKNKSLDSKIFNLLFSRFSVYPVDSCFDVIHYTKAFNKIPNMSITAYGVIDSDHHSDERLRSLEKDYVYSFSMAEIDNLFLDEGFLTIVAKQLLQDQSVVNLIKKDIINKFSQDLELQISNYLSTKINYYFHDSHVSKGNNRSAVESNLKNFIDGVKITEWYNLRKTKLEGIIHNQDYQRILQVYNNKGLKEIAQKHLKTSEFTDFSLRVLGADQAAHEILKKHFPEQLCK
jgi:ABC-type cobalamin/Fe3+-siderophores transport system ATPase subunit